MDSTQKDEFSYGLWVSLSVHLGIAAIFMLKTVFWSGDAAPPPPAIRVDIVGLPPKNQSLPARPTEKPEGKPAPEPKALPPKEVAQPKPEKDTINLSATKAKQQEALAKLKAQSALEKIKSDVSKAERDRLLKAAADARAKAGEVKVRGNILAAGSELTGIDRIQHEDYRNLLDRHIKPNWQIPEWLMRKGYHATAVVRIDGRGQIISRHLIRSSGNPDYDSNVLETIDRSAPMPPPPEKLSAKVGIEGVIVVFGEEGGPQ